MNRPILRKLQITGGSTFIVSLPKSWIKTLGLNAGDIVEIYQDKDMKLIIVPRKAGNKEESLNSVIECRDSEIDYIIREMIAYYMAGYSTVSIFCTKMKANDIAVIKDFIRRRLLGGEIVDETANSLVIQFLVSVKELSISKAISRASHLALNMLLDSLTSIKDENYELSKQVILRDDEVDRLYFYISRQLTLSLSIYEILEKEEINFFQIPDYHLVSRYIERVADHAVRIATLAEKIKLEKELTSLIYDYGIKISQIYKKSINAFINRKKEISYEVLKDNKIIQEHYDITSRLVSSKGDVESLSNALLVLDSLRRINRYSFDIAEVTINMLAKEKLR
ncbi:MAG: PhoU domain-containing protein [Sulfolobaceae archaeon]